MEKNWLSRWNDWADLRWIRMCWEIISTSNSPFSQYKSFYCRQSDRRTNIIITLTLHSSQTSHRLTNHLRHSLNIDMYERMQGPTGAFWNGMRDKGRGRKLIDQPDGPSHCLQLAHSILQLLARARWNLDYSHSTLVRSIYPPTYQPNKPSIYQPI